MHDSTGCSHPAVCRLGSDHWFIYNYNVAAVYLQLKRCLITSKIAYALGSVIANDRQESKTLPHGGYGRCIQCVGVGALVHAVTSQTNHAGPHCGIRLEQYERII